MGDIDAQSIKPVIANEIAWYNVQHWGVEGKGWNETEHYFDRFPAKAKGVVRDPVWTLSRQTAGLCVEFATDSVDIHVRWTLTLERLAMAHFPATGVSGVDLYAKDAEGRWRWVATGQPDKYPTLEKLIAGGLRPGYRQYRLYLPLYNGVVSLEIGVKEDAQFKPILPRTEKPIVFYGTSIVQGGCASRPGNCHPAILGRRLDKPVINLGFSGQAKMEPEVAELVAELDPCIFVIDPVPNMDGPMVVERAEAFFRILRAKHTHTPIVMIEDRTLQNAPFMPQREANHAATRLALRQAYERLVASGIINLLYVRGEDLLGDDYEGTVDGSHPTDLGFFRMSNLLEPVLKSLL